MKKLVFARELLQPTLRGEKEITIRLYRIVAHDFIEGEFIKGEFLDGPTIDLEITANTELKRASDITDKEAHEDGFEDAKHAYQELKLYYPDLKEIDTVAIIRYILAN